ncbi:rhomboid family intramembrane serine protease [Psychroflexus gondwanensis]|jgi:membrane associated rhomboid family serine protease|uniref:Membrane-associated serine protease, rhomboid superfamily protein n=1 Tax=Psychroflexus gondwanensis ACAM 44 TaxID=1189619 RepID=N1WPY4_9FLAO|nr:rhomboid family intramembrane serine protease [Psychroflexus gondwanensis]EMY82351.1 membrane-associated serine protease, rhomboid superfamily protein [Psychroflexus gondwanensis ACAM 44]TXE17533.1 rhomboid family intramembrane serine protease [Psychroflexus gondwanensis]
MGGIDLVIIAVIAANVLMSFKGFNDFQFFNKYKFEVSSIKAGDKIRILSSGFLHVDTTHLFVNMLTLYFFASSVTSFLGTTGFLLVYFGSLIIGNLLSFYFHKDEYAYTAVGASGAVVGVLYAAILLQPDMMLGLFFIIPMPAYVFGIGYLFYSIWAMKARRDNVGHDAHFGGAMGGYFITLLLSPWVLKEHLLMVILLAVPILVLFVLQKMGKL